MVGNLVLLLLLWKTFGSGTLRVSPVHATNATRSKAIILQCGMLSDHRSIMNESLYGCVTLRQTWEWPVFGPEFSATSSWNHRKNKKTLNRS